jgi:phosphoribosylformylglycinamidine synthase I
MASPPVLVLHASGTNRDHEAAYACDRAGGRSQIVHINQLTGGERHLKDYAMLVIPGGFSYSDDLGAGMLLALDLRYRLEDELERFIDDGKAVLGICNGFQALVKSGFLPGHTVRPSSATTRDETRQRATLARNRSARFECHWVHLRPNPASPCVFTQGRHDLLYVPVAHGEGRFFTDNEMTWTGLKAAEQIAVTYVDRQGNPATYPDNPNGSDEGVAGICNARGNVFGLMPHPEDHVLPHQHPRWTRGESAGAGLPIFEAGMRYVENL